MPNISLHLPKSWDELTTAQLEAVSAILIDEARKYSSSGTFSQVSLLTRCFFALTGLRPVGLPRQDTEGQSAAPPEDPITFGDPDEHTYYQCEYTDLALRNQRQYVEGHGIGPIRICLYEIKSLAIGDILDKDLQRYLKRLELYDKRIAAGKEAEPPTMPSPQGPLSWLLKPSTRTIVPYPELTLPDPHHQEGQRERWLDPNTLQPAVRTVPATVTLTGPAEMMQDFSWRQYRFACDFMSYLAQVENAELDARAHHHAARAERLHRDVVEVRAQFLATLFTRPVLHQDPDTHQLVYAPRFTASQCQDNAYLFRDFPDEKFQVISLWWQGMMHYLAQQFPKVFRSTGVGKAAVGADHDPLSLYTRSTTTMIKYAAANEEEVNATTYTVILQHMNDMAEENERIEQMKNNR